MTQQFKNELFIPFTKGQSEAVDAKLLPQGLFSSCVNVRYQKDGKLGVRPAYRGTIASQTNQAPIGAATYDQKQDLYFQKQYIRGLSATAFLNAYGAAAVPIGGSATAPNTYSVIPSGPTSPARLIATKQQTLNTVEVASLSVLYVSDTQCYIATTAIDTTSKASAVQENGFYLNVTLVNPLTGALLNTQSVFAASAISNAKMALVNGAVCVFYALGASDEVRMTSYDTTANMSLVTNNVLVVNTFAGKAYHFDISPGGASTEAYLIYQSSSTVLTFGTVSSVGVFAALTGGTITGTGPEIRPSLSPTGLAPTDQIAIVYNDGATFSTGNVGYGVYRRSTNNFLIAAANFYTAGDAVGYPVVSGHTDATIDVMVAFNRAGTGGKQSGCAMFSFTGAGSYLASINDVYGQFVVSKPFVANVFAGVLTTDMDAYAQAPGSYYLTNCYSSTSPQSVVEWCQLAAQPAEPTVLRRDPRQAVPVGATALSAAPGSLAALALLPTKTTLNNGWRFWRLEYGVLEDAFAPANLNADLHFAGGRITTFDGANITESGLSLPEVPTLAAGAGTIPAGTYQVVVIWEWYDAKGRRHKSAPSLPATIVLASAGSITVTGGRPRATNKRIASSSSSDGTAVAVRIYRTTLAQPTIFLDAIGQKVALSITNGYSASLTASDTTIGANEAIYTQGAQGGLSGLLQNDRPPGAKYIWAGSDRLIIGGMENPSECWFSKLRVEGEPMQWTNFASYKVQVDGVVSAVAEMDGTWYIGTYNAWWQVTGDGPDDNGANGSFGAPRRLPTDIGPISHKSLILTGQGLIFQGRTDCFFLLPRGGGAPQPIGWQVRDTLTSFPYVTASAYDQQSNICYWAVCDTAGSVGRLIIYDTRIGEWYVDSYMARVIRTLAINNSLLRIDGQIIETPGQFQDNNGGFTGTVLPVLVTGDIRPFGLTGTGRLRKAQIEGEARDVITAFTPTLDVSYDSGKTFAENPTWPIASLATTIGDSIDGAEHLLKFPRGDTFRFRLSWSTPSATEGILWNGLSLEAYPERGLKRVANSVRT